MKKLVLITLVLGLPLFTYSQADFKKGFIITQAKDTVFGLVGYREGYKSYKTCDFRKSKTEAVTTYQPSEIIGYGLVKGEFFEARTIQEKKKEPKLVFLQEVVRGQVSLYRYEEIFFLEKDDNVLRQLINETEEAFVDPFSPQQFKKRVLLQSNEHIAIMNMLLVECAELRSRIPKVRLTESELTRLIEDYNTCRSVPYITFKSEKPWIKTSIGISGGSNISAIDFTTKNLNYKHLLGAFSTSKTPMAGLTLDISSPKLSERLSFHADAFYLNSNYYLYSVTTNSSMLFRNYVSIGLQQLKVPFGVRYTLPEKTFTPYFNAGASNTFHLNTTSSYTQEVESNNVVDTYHKDAVDFKKNQWGFWGGIGVLKSITPKLAAFAEVRYEQTNGISQQLNLLQPDVKSTVTNIQIIIGIRTK